VLKLPYVPAEEGDLCFEKNSNLMKYQIFSHVVSTLLSILKHKINIDNENMDLNQDEQVLISQISVIVHEMAFQISLLEDANLAKPFKEQLALTDSNKCPFSAMNESLSWAKLVIRDNYEKLFPLWLVQILVEVIFRDMQEANKLFSAEHQKL
jgi:hypothetical protein